MKRKLLCSLCGCGLLIAGTAWATGPQNPQEAAMVAQMKKAYAAQGLTVTPEAEEQFLQRYRQMQGGVIQAKILAGSVDKSTPAGAMAAMSAIGAAVRNDAPAPMSAAQTSPHALPQPPATQPSNAQPTASPAIATTPPATAAAQPEPKSESAPSPSAQTSTPAMPGLLADLQSAKTVWVPIHVAGRATNWSNTYQLYIDGQRVQTPVGNSVGGFIHAPDGGYVALVQMEPGSQAYRQLQQGTFQGDILTPNMQQLGSANSFMWAFYKLDSAGRAQRMLGVAACSTQGQVPGTVRTEATPDALFCHEAFQTNGEDGLVGVSAAGEVLHGPTGYAQVFAAKDYFVGATRTVVRANAICMDTRAHREYWPLTNDNGRWTRGAQIVVINEAQKHIADIDRVESSSVYVDMPSYSPTWLTNVVTYQSHGDACSSLGPPDSFTAMGSLPELAQWVASGASPRAANQYHVSVGRLTDHGAGSAPIPLGAGLARHMSYGFHAARGTGGLGFLSALVGDGNNSIGMEFVVRDYAKDVGTMIFRPIGAPGLSYASIQTPDNLYLVPLKAQGITGKPDTEGLVYSAGAGKWENSESLRSWLTQYSIKQ